MARPTGEGARLAQAKRAERERRRSAQRRAMRLRIILGLVAIIALIAGWRALVRSPLFVIQDIEVTGVRHLAPDEVVAAAAVPQGTSLLACAAKEIEQRVERHPWVADATVRKRVPDTLRIVVLERMPVAIVDTVDRLWVVDADGFALGEHSLEATSSLPVIRGVPGLTLASGQRTSSEVLRNALLVLVGLSDELAKQVRAVSAPSVDETTLITHDNVEILVGSPVEIDKKDAVAVRILREQSGSVVFIDVRDPARPVARGLER